MGLFNSLLKTALDTVKLPVSATKDIIDIVVDNETQPRTENNINDIVDDIVDDIEDVFDKLI